MRGLSRTVILRHGFVPSTMRIHVLLTIPGTIRALVKLISLTDSEVGAFKSCALIKILLGPEVNCEAGGISSRQQKFTD